MALIAEGNYERVVQSVGARPTRRTPIVLGEFSTQTREFASQLRHSIFLIGNTINDARLDQATWLNLVVHEFAHVCTYYKLRSGPVPSTWEWVTAPLVPGWLYEGIAESEANRYSQLGYSVLRAAVLEDALPPVAAMDYEAEGPLTDLWLKYAAGQSMVAYMVELGGEDTVQRILTEFRDFPDMDKALRDVLGVSYNEFYRNWQAYVRAHYEPVLKMHHPVEEYSRGLDLGVAMVRAAEVSPDGAKVAFTAMVDTHEHSMQLFVSDIDGQNRRLISSDTDLYKSVVFSWSPDSKRLAYGRYWSKPNGVVRFGLYVHDLETGRNDRISHDENCMDPAWSPDGKWIAHVRFDGFGEASRLALMDPEGGNVRLLTAGEDMPLNVFRPTWAPDSQTLACEVVHDGNVNLATIGVEGDGFRMILDDESGYNRAPAWSPTEDRIAFYSYRKGIPQIYVYDLATEKLTMVSQEGIRTLYDPSWTPDGKELAVAAWGSQTSELRFLDASRTFGEAEDLPRRAAEGYEPHYRAAAPLEETYASVDASKWVTKKYDSWDSVQFYLVRPNIITDPYGYQPALRLFAEDPLQQHQFAAEISYSLQAKRPGYLLQYGNDEHRWGYEVRLSEALEANTLPNGAPQGVIDVDRLYTIAGRYARNPWESTLRRDQWRLGLGYQEFHTVSLTDNAPFPDDQGLTFAEASYSTYRLKPAEGNESLTATFRAGMPWLSDNRRLYDAVVDYDRVWTYNGARDSLTAGLDARALYTSDRAGGNIQGGYVLPSLTYQKRLATYAWHGMWPELWLDQVNARFIYDYYYSRGAGLLNRWPGHRVRAELIGTGNITQAVPFTLTLAAEYQSGAPRGSEMSYWLQFSTDAPSVFGY